MAITEYSLLDRGYLPRKLPPPFRSRTFAAAIYANSSGLPKSFTRNPPAEAWSTTYNLARQGTLRRKLGIPNPINQVGLNRQILASWSTLTRLTAQSRLSKSKPIEGRDRAITPEISQADLYPIRLGVRRGAKFILHADVSQFYGSIYTHAIAWAVHGKANAKPPAARRANTLGNRLDKWVRNGQGQQTIGVPIGPDTSFVIAEIIGSAIDGEVLRRKRNARGYRRIDDQEYGFATRDEAEVTLGILQDAYAEYELVLNPLKTYIEELPGPVEPRWVTELRMTPFGRNWVEQRYGLITLFDRAFEYARQSPEEPVLNYALGFTERRRITPENMSLYQDLLIICLTSEAGTIRKVLRQLRVLRGSGFTLDADILQEVLGNMIRMHAPQGHSSEVAWALWSSIELNIPVASNAVNVLPRMNDSVVALVALDCQKRGLIPASVVFGQWHAMMKSDELWGPNWLLAYEANIKAWLPSVGSADHVNTVAEFSLLKSWGVTFYQRSQRLVPRPDIPRTRRRRRRIPPPEGY